jgi:hypothetical protein
MDVYKRLFSQTLLLSRNQIYTTNGDKDIVIALQARKETMQIQLVALI